MKDPIETAVKKILDIVNNKDSFEYDIHLILIDLYQLGLREGIAVLDHEREKLLDGFSHPKDCPRCGSKPASS